MVPTASSAHISDIREREWTKNIQVTGFGFVVFLVGLLVWYFCNYIPPGAGRSGGHIFAGAISLTGFGLMCYAILRIVQVKKIPIVTYPCPYCETPNQFSATPTDSFVCEACNRTVHFEKGAQIPIRVVECQFCHTDHRVAVNVQRFVCDRCNRPVQLVTNAGAANQPTQRMAKAHDLTASLPQDIVDPNVPLAAPSGLVDTEGMVAPTGRVIDETQVGAMPPSAGDAMALETTPQDVVLTSFDRRKETEVAFKIQSLLRITLPDARRQMSEASATSPLVIARNLSPLKADAIRRQLQDLGATATTRPTELDRPDEQQGV